MKRITSVPHDAVHLSVTPADAHPCRFYRYAVARLDSVRDGDELEHDPTTGRIRRGREAPVRRPDVSIRLSKITCPNCRHWLDKHPSAWNAARAADHQSASERTSSLFGEG